MKHTYLLYIALPLLSLAINSCDGKLDDLIENNEYTVSKDASYATFENLTDSFDVESSSASKTLNIKSAGASWFLSSDESWIHFSPANGTGDQAVSCSFDNNPYAYQKRRGTITLSTSRSKVNTVAIQKTSSPETTCDPSSINMTAAGGTATVDVTSNCTNLRVGDMPEWVEAYYDNGKLTITLAPNRTSYSRYGRVDLEYDYLPYYYDELTTSNTSVNISQSSPSITVSPSAYQYINADGGTLTLEITSDLPWETSDNTDEWLQYYPVQGESGTTTMTVTVSPNETYSSRTSYIRLYVGTNNIQTIEIYQYAKSRY